MKRPLNALGVKNVSEAHLTCKSIYGYTVEKDPSNVLSVTNVSPGNRHCLITKENSILIHRTNVNHVVRISLMTMLWRDMIARNDLLETKKDSLAGCVMNTATIIVDIFITCINTCKHKWSYKRRPYRDTRNTIQQRFMIAWGTLKMTFKTVVFTRYLSVSVCPCSLLHSL